MDASLVGVVVVSNVSVVAAVCVVDVEGNDESPEQDMFNTTSAKKYLFSSILHVLTPIIIE